MISEMLANPISSKFQCLGHYFSLTVLKTSPGHLQMELQGFFPLFYLGSTMFHSNVNSLTIFHPKYLAIHAAICDVQSSLSFNPSQLIPLKCQILTT